MPINKFNGFYYGVGVKLDEKSIKEMSSQLEGKLNKTVSKVTQEIEALQKALEGGASADFSHLVKSLNEAASSLGHVDGADFAALKTQVGQLETRFNALDESAKKIGQDLTQVTVKFEGLVKGLSETMNRYMQQPKVMRDNLKQDLKNMANMASSYADVLKLDPNADTSGLSEYFAEFKKQFQGISDLSDFTTKEIADGFFKLGDALRQLGAPFDEIRLDLVQMTSSLKGAFEVKNDKSAKNIFSNMGYQADLLSQKVQEGQNKINELQAQLSRLSGLASGKAGKFNGGKLAADDKILSLDQQIAKIEEYDNKLQSIEAGSAEWESILQKQMSLVRHVEKELNKLGENGVNKAALEQWKDFYSMFTGIDYEFGGDKLGDSILSSAIQEAKSKSEELNKILAEQTAELQKNKSNLTKALEDLLGVQAKSVDVGKSKKNKNKTNRKSLKTDLVELVEEVKLKAKIDEAEWRKSINDTIKVINESNKVKPIHIDVKIKNLKEVKQEIQAIKSAQLITDGTKKTGKNAGTDKDAENFNKRFENLKKTIESKQKELAVILRDWHDQFNDMFVFQFKINGLKKDEYGDLTTIIPNLVDDINAKLEEKPLQFQSNIEELVESITEQLKNIKIDNLKVDGITTGGIGAGGIILPEEILKIIKNSSDESKKNSGGSKDDEKKPKDTGNKPKDDNSKPTSAGQAQVDALLEAWTKMTNKQRDSLGRKTPDLARAMSKLQQNPTWETYREQILQFADITKSVQGIKSKAKGVNNFVDLLKADMKLYEQTFGKPLADSAVQQRDQRWFENGQQIVEHVIKLAELAAKISPLKSKDGVKITEEMFKDGDLSRWIAGRQVSKKDIGTVIGKKDVTDTDVDTFLKRMGMTRENLVNQTDKDFSQYLNPLLEAINNFKIKQENLNKELTRLQQVASTSDFVNGFESSENKSAYLADQLKWLKNIATTGGKTKGQQHLLEAFKNNNIDISAFKNVANQAELWKQLQNKVLNNPQVDFNKLMGDLRSGKSSFGQSYQDFVEILGIAKRFADEAQSLDNIGEVANLLISGKKETVTKRDRDGNEIERKTKTTLGLRDVLNSYGIVIRENDGSTFGYRAGQDTTNRGIYGRNESFSNIVRQLSAALGKAVEIAFSKKSANGLDVKKYEPYKTEPKATFGSNLYENRNIASRYVDYYTQQVNILQNRLKEQERNYKNFTKQNGESIYNFEVEKKIKQDVRGKELLDKRKLGSLTAGEEAEFQKILQRAQEALKQQAESLEKTMQETSKHLANAKSKLVGAQSDYSTFNKEIQKYEKDLNKKRRQQATKQPTPEAEVSQGSSGGKVGSRGVYMLGGGSGAGGIVVGGQSGIATEATLSAIYNALVGNNGKDNPQLNAQIEALERTIAAMEDAARAEQESAKKATPKKKDVEPGKKKTESSKKAPDAESKAAEEARKKAEAEKRAAEEKSKAEAAKKEAEEKAKAEAAKKAAEENKKKQEQQKKDTKPEKEDIIKAIKELKEEQAKAAKELGEAREQLKKAEEEERKKAAAAKKTSPQYNHKDAIQQSVGKSEQELFKSSQKYLGEIDSYMKIFREHVFTLKNGVVDDISVGTHSKGGVMYLSDFDTYGHTHPSNNIYSGQDFLVMKNIKEGGNKDYNKDVLLTPDYKFELSEIDKVSSQMLTELASTFDYIHQYARSLGYTDLGTSILKTYGNKYGFKFSAQSFGENGQLVDFTDKIPTLSDEFIDLLLQANKIQQQANERREKVTGGKPSAYVEDAELGKLMSELNLLKKKIQASDDYKTLKNTSLYKKVERPDLFFATRFQDALDNDWSLKPLAEDFKELMYTMSAFEDKISKDSPYFKIKETYQNAPESDRVSGDVLESIRPLLKDFFGVSKTSGDPDERFYHGYSKRYGADFDKKYPGWEKRLTYGKGYNYSNIDHQASLPELKAELARLKSMRDVTNVRFATQDKQDEIISILSGGVKVEGFDGKTKTGTGGGDKQDGQDKKKTMTIGEQAKKAQDAIGDMSQEASVKVDSTGKETIYTIKKIGAETAKITQTTEDGVTKSTLELSNKYEMAMKELFQKIRGDSSKYLFGAETVQFGTEATEAQDILLKYADTYRKLEEAMAQYKQSGNILLSEGPNQGKQLQAVIDGLQAEFGEYEQRLISISNHSQSFLGGKAPFAMLNGAQVKDSANNLKLLAMNTEQFGVAFNGVYNNGKKLMYDVLQDGTIKSYSLEVDEATGNVRKFEHSQTALVNAFQNVNKAAKQGKELKSIFINDDVNKNATVIQNYKNAYKEMNNYVRQAWDAARQNGGLIPIDEQNKIYALSQEVLRLGATIQNEYKKIANFRDAGGIYESLGPIADPEMLETKMTQYLNRFAEGQTAQLSNIKYDSVTKSMTADLVGLYGEITKVKVQYNEMINSVQVMSAKESGSIDQMATEMDKLGDSINTAIDAGVINQNMAEYQAYAAELAKLDALIANILDGTTTYNYDAIAAWQAQRQAVVDTGKALAEIAKKNAQKSLPGVRAVESQSVKKIQIDNAMEHFNIPKDLGGYEEYEKAYKELIDLREKFREQGTLGLDENQKALQVAADKVRLLGAEVEKFINKTQQSVGAVTNQKNKKIQIDNAIAGTNVGSKNQAYLKYIGAYEKLIQLEEKYRANGTLGKDENIKNLQIEAEKVRVLAVEVEKLINTSNQIMSGASAENIKFMPDLDINNLESEMKRFAGVSEDATKEQWKFNDVTKQATYVIKDENNVVHEMSMRYDTLNQALVRTETQHYKAKTAAQQFLDSLKAKFQEVGRYLLSFGSIYQVWGWIRQGVTYVKEIDSALTELKKVTNETDVTYNKFLKTMSKTAGVVGSTTSELTTMAAEWARLGYSIEEAGKLAESTAVLLNVSEFQDANSASQALISTMQAFQYTADESQHVVDILNEVGNNYAVSSDGIATALQDSASALMEAGNNLEQSVALVAAANKVVQDPNSVGSALRTISLRLRGTSVKVLEEMGEETDGVVESVSKMQEKIKALTGVDILTDSGAYKETYEILREIGGVWEDMSDIDQAALLELMAGIEFYQYVQKCA